MTARTGDIIEQARAVIAKTPVPPGVAIADAVAASLADAGLLTRPLPTRDEIIRTLAVADGQVLDGYDLTHAGAAQYGAQADAVLALMEGDKR